MEQSTDPRGENIFDVVLQTKNMGNRHDYSLWNVKTNDRDPVGVARAGAPPDTPPPPPFPLRFPPRGRFNAGIRSNTLGEKGETARLVETLALASVGKSTQKLYLRKVEHLDRREGGAGQGAVVAAQPRQPESGVVRADGVHGMPVLRAQQSAVNRKGVSHSNQVFPQDVRRLGIANFALYDCRRGKGD